ncbi:hypothetical protein EKH79_03140 [Dyella dinghuensis]|uniref:Integrase catalytic domain-containing protein n=1 Tax=Dyella dinghuensis TaxID=1920169 RepID=A0A3S0RGK7_9GAMM|nr:Mu transposase C-terminal domain-containing protein [Dyella dinghuensis]RUL66819.1 hypothetical protein EKH79_03140 [Dyella dinghuensis]
MEIEAAVLRLEPGTKILCDGAIHEIDSVVSVDAVLIKNICDGVLSTVPIYKLKPYAERQVAAAELVVSDMLKKHLDEASAREVILREYAGRRLTKDDMAKLMTALGMKPTRIYEFLRILRKDSRPKAIASRRRGPKPGTTKLSPQKEAIIVSVINMHRKSKKPTRLKAIYDDIERQCANAGLPCPSRETMRDRIENHGRELAFRQRLGRKRAREATTPKPGVIRTSHALALVEMDHSPLDMILVDRVHRKHIGRAYLSVMVDAHTRVVLGFMLSLGGPSIMTVALLTTHSILCKDKWLAERGITDLSWPMYGVYKVSRTDNADEFHSDEYADGCKAWGIDPPTFRDIGKKEQGAIVERIIGTIQCRVERAPGATGNGVKHRQEYDPTHDSVMTIEEAEEWLAYEILGVYHNDTHSELGMSPTAAWRQAHMTPEGLRLPPIVTSQRKLLLDFLPSETRLVTAAGIHLLGDRYWAPALNPLVGSKEPVTVKYDERNMATIFVRTETGDYIDVPYADHAKPALPLWEIKAMRKEKALEAVRQYDPAIKHNARNKQAEIVDKAKKSTRERRRQERLAEADKATGVSRTSSKPVAPPSITPRLDYSVRPSIDVGDEV